MRRLLPLLVLAAAACSEPTSPEIEGRFEITPPAVYESWWAEIQRCSGQTGDFSRIRWFGVTAFPDRPTLLGQWNSNHEITLRSDLLGAWPVVAHEMLHELLDGDPEHVGHAWLNCAIPVGRGG